MSKREQSKRRSVPKAVSSAIAELTSGLGIGGTLDRFSVVTGWSALVGEQIARVSTAQRMENGVLYVSVNTAPWRAELTMRRREIVDKINTTLGKKVVHDIRFR